MLSLLSDRSHEIKPRRSFGHAPALYVMGCDVGGPVKIGYTSDIARRVVGLQTGNALPILVFGIRLAMPRFIPAGAFSALPLLKESAFRLEKSVHANLRRIGMQMMGEWFDLSSGEAIEVIEKSAENIRCRVFSREWLSGNEAKVDPEFGWASSDLLSKAADAEAQAAKVNTNTLTCMSKSVIFSTSEGS